MEDHMEAMIAGALDKAGIRYTTGYGGGNPSGLDFNLIDYAVEIEVKRLHSPRIAEQMSRAPNVIAAQGDVAVRFLADAIAGLKTPYQPAPNEVTAEDREAYLSMNMLPEFDAADVRAGLWDKVTGIQAFAHHRLAQSAADRAEIERLRAALDEIKSACANEGAGNPIVNERIIDRCDDIAHQALEPKP